MTDLPCNFTPKKELVKDEYWQIVHVHYIEVVNNYLAMGFELVWVNTLSGSTVTHPRTEYILRKKLVKK